MIKTMILEEVAKLKKKKNALIDIDFSKAYDSTENLRRPSHLGGWDSQRKDWTYGRCKTVAEKCKY